MATRYETDVVAWANEQAALLRAGNFAALDIAHIADEVEDVGKSEYRELKTRMSLLIAHLLKWAFQPARRSKSWELTIREQRKGIERHLAETPSLKASLTTAAWQEGVWGDALLSAVKETELDSFPETCPWTMLQILDRTFFPD